MQQKPPFWPRSKITCISKSAAIGNLNFADCKKTAQRMSLSYVVCQLDVQSPSSGTSETAGSSWGQNSFPLSGCSTMTTRRHIHRFPSRSFWSKKNQAWSWNTLFTQQFFVFDTMKNHLKGPTFETADELLKSSTAVLNNLRENEFWHA
jgi:hypothetical protein